MRHHTRPEISEEKMELFRKTGQIGGRITQRKLTPEERTARMTALAHAKWAKYYAVKRQQRRKASAAA